MQSLWELSTILQHPAMNRNQRQSTGCLLTAQTSGVKGLDLRECHRDTTRLWEFMALLPVMSGVMTCNLSLNDENVPGEEFDRGLETLWQLPHVLPNLERLSFFGCVTQEYPLTDQAVLSLSTLSSLRRFEMSSHLPVSLDRLKGWKAVLSRIVDWAVNVESI